MKRRKKAASARKGPPKRKGPKLTVQVTVPPRIELNGAELGDLSASQRLDLASLGTKRSGSSIPPWVHDHACWRKAIRAVARFWKRYEHPYAAVAYVYLRMGGSPSAGAARVRGRINEIGVGAFPGYGPSGGPSHHPPPRARARRSGVELDVMRVELDALGYDEHGRYFGVGQPVFHVESIDMGIDKHVRAPTAAAARAQVLESHRH